VAYIRIYVRKGARDVDHENYSGRGVRHLAPSEKAELFFVLIPNRAWFCQECTDTLLTIWFFFLFVLRDDTEKKKKKNKPTLLLFMIRR